MCYFWERFCFCFHRERKLWIPKLIKIGFDVGEPLKILTTERNQEDQQIGHLYCCSLHLESSVRLTETWKCLQTELQLCTANKSCWLQNPLDLLGHPFKGHKQTFIMWLYSPHYLMKTDALPAWTESSKSKLTDVRTLYIPCIWHCRNVCHVWRLVCLQTPMKLGWPWQDSRSGILKRMLRSSNYLFQVLFPQNLYPGQFLNSQLGDPASRTVPARTSFKPWTLSAIRNWTANATTSILKTSQTPKA